MSLITQYSHRILIALLMLSWLAGPRASGQGQPTKNPAPPGFKESLVNLSLEGSDLKPDSPLPGGKEQTPEFVRELVRLQWRPGDPIDVYVIRPAKVQKPPVVLYLYSFPNDAGRFKDNRYCRRLVQNGAAAVGFVSALTGERIRGNRPMREWFVSELPEALVTTVHDVQFILYYLETRGDLDMSRVGIFGQGSGGAIAVLAAATDHRLKALDLLNPWGDWPDWVVKSPAIPPEERSRYMKADYLKRLEPFEPDRYLPALKSRAVRIQFVDDEMSATKVSAAKIQAAAPPTAKTIHYPNGRAMYSVSSDGRLFAWISTVLKSSGAAQQSTGKTVVTVSKR